MAVKICGTGSYLPERVLSNQKLSAFVDTSDAWIFERTGIRARHIVTEETTVSMAAEAGRRALHSAGMKPEEIDLIIVSTISSEVVLPSAACEVQRHLGAFRAFCFDLNAACTGFVLAFAAAQAYIQTGMASAALIIGSEALSNLTNWEDRGSCILFGDGAGAAVLKKTDRAAYLGAAHSDGKEGSALRCQSPYRRGPVKVFGDSRAGGRPGSGLSPEYLMQMDGRAVFEFALRKVPEVIDETLKKNGVNRTDIRFYLLHQANRRIIEGVAKRMREDIGKFPVNVEKYGNTSSASIPILLDELNKGGKLKRGDKLILAGFGAGLTWGAALVEW